MTNNRYKLLEINFDVNTFIFCLGTNFVQSFIFLKIKAYNLIQLIVFATEWPPWLLTPKGSYFVSKYMLLWIKGWI